MADYAYVIELRGVYDGWSIGVLPDGTLVNRWARPDANVAYQGYERRFEAAEKAIAAMREEETS